MWHLADSSLGQPRWLASSLRPLVYTHKTNIWHTLVHSARLWGGAAPRHTTIVGAAGVSYDMEMCGPPHFQAWPALPLESPASDSMLQDHLPDPGGLWSRLSADVAHQCNILLLSP
jgi:hypothetical protein